MPPCSLLAVPCCLLPRCPNRDPRNDVCLAVAVPANTTKAVSIQYAPSSLESVAFELPLLVKGINPRSVILAMPTL